MDLANSIRNLLLFPDGLAELNRLTYPKPTRQVDWSIADDVGCLAAHFGLSSCQARTQVLNPGIARVRLLGFSAPPFPTYSNARWAELPFLQ